jgi:hypothetical protein
MKSTTPNVTSPIQVTSCRPSTASISVRTGVAPAAGSAFPSSMRRRTSWNVLNGPSIAIGSGTRMPVATLPTSAFCIHCSGLRRFTGTSVIRSVTSDIPCARCHFPIASAMIERMTSIIVPWSAWRIRRTSSKGRSMPTSRRALPNAPRRLSGEWLSNANACEKERSAMSACGTRDGCITVSTSTSGMPGHARSREPPGRGLPP